MKKIFLVLFLITPLGAEEQVDLTTPVVADPRSATYFRVQRLTLDWTASQINIQVGDGTISKDFSYNGTQARNMMIALNKANLTSNSLNRRILNQLISSGFLTGTISGTPD